MRVQRLRSRVATVLVAAAVVVSPLTGVSARAAAGVPSPGAGSGPSEPSVAPPAGPKAVQVDVKVAERDRLLGPGWQKSTGRAWTLIGSSAGLQVLAADESKGYRWQVRATLGEIGFDTDQWIGNGCLTGSGRYLVVVYAPRSFTNDQVAFDKAGFSAVVDLSNGKVRKLATTASLAYANPGCGTGETAVLSQFDHKSSPRTRLIVVNAATGAGAAPRVAAGELTSAVPYQGSVWAAQGSSLVEVGPTGQVRKRGSATGALSRLRPTTDGRIVATETIGETARVLAFRAGGSMTGSVLGSGPRSAVKTHQLPHGQVALTGTTQTKALGAGIKTLPWAGEAEKVADTGGLAVRSVTTEAGDQVTIDAVTDQAKPVQFVVPVAALSPGDSSPALRTAAAGDADNPIDSAATCAVPRNDVRTQAYQPNPRQVEWAVDQAVKNNLKTARPANWKQSGLPSYTPQLMTKFQLPALHGGGMIPPQILLGVLAQESNLWQASGHSIETLTGNPLIGNFYGRVSNGWEIDFSKADCGYGIGQITDGMRKGSTVWGGLNEQRAIALDYTVNIAAAAKILAEKWNQLYDAGVLINGGNSARLESWFGAVWAYNSGFYPQGQDPTGAWGLGWTNNPMSGLWDPARKPFLDFNHYADAAHPQDWPYQEKVMGWAAYPLVNPRLGASYRASWWSDAGMAGTIKRSAVKPPLAAFCDAVKNECKPPVPPNTSNCSRSDIKCWWHFPVSWKDCLNGADDPCGHYLDRFDTTYPEPQPDSSHTPPDPEQNPAACSTAGLPPAAEVIDDMPNGVTSSRCSSGFSSAGTFSLHFASQGNPAQYTSKIDFHQIGMGFMGHAWFTHSQANKPEREVTGTWQLGRSLNGWARVMVHMPDTLGDAQQARYVVNLGDGTTKTRVLLQHTYANKWVSLGVFKFAGTPKVSLSSKTFDGDGSEDIAWDAIAFQSLPGKPSTIAVSLGDSYSSGEGASETDGRDFYRESNNHGWNSGTGEADPHRNACHRSPFAWSRLGVLAGSSLPIGQRADAWDPAVEHDLLACSDAHTENLLPNLTVPAGQTPPQNGFGLDGRGQYREVSELDRGFLDENTTLVTLSIGGNDARFGPVIEKCIKLLTDVCQNSTLEGDGSPLKDIEPNLIAGPVEDSVVTVLTEIRKRAPAAKIMLMGYPGLLEGDGGCVPGIGTAETPWLNAMGALIAQHLGEAVDRVGGAAAGVYFSDPRDEFKPNGPNQVGYGICGNPAKIRGIVTTLTDGDEPLTSISWPGKDPAVGYSIQSFHPDKNGQIVYAQSFNETLRRMGL
ncbi:hypothetical protein [Kribbella sp. NPDC006257]|uniref:golvesin C-terminal-like domain-containing protein n=1 Tax=Kribbella sp. NPDC006257 TaxID=3156738 RepID=UPI0033B1BA12